MENTNAPVTKLAGAESGLNAGLADAIAKADSLRRMHEICDGDCWYSCPASGECCDEDAGTKCNCGADAHNAKVDELVKLLISMSANVKLTGCANSEEVTKK